MPRLGRHRFSKSETVNRRFGEWDSVENVHLVTFDERRRAADGPAAGLHHKSIYYPMHSTHINPKPENAEFHHISRCSVTRDALKNFSVAWSRHQLVVFSNAAKAFELHKYGFYERLHFVDT